MTEIHENFEKQTMMQAFGAEIEEVSKGRVIITAPIKDFAKQHHGFGHAALTFALGDTAAGYAAATMMEPGKNVLTSEIKINLLAPAQHGPLRAVGEVVKPGRRLIVVRADVFDGDKLIAIMQGTMVPV